MTNKDESLQEEQRRLQIELDAAVAEEKSAYNRMLAGDISEATYDDTHIEIARVTALLDQVLTDRMS